MLAVAAAICAECGDPVPRGHRVTCGRPACRWRRADRQKRANPEYIVATRARCRRWWVARHGDRRQPWLVGAPPFGEYLPGGGSVIDVSPFPVRAIEHRHVRGLHGMITALAGEGHDPRRPGFALVPWPCRLGWGVYLWSDEIAERLGNRSHDAVLFNRPVTVRLIGKHRVRTPTVTARGRHRLRIDAITPVTIRTMAGATMYTAPTDTVIKSALTVAFPDRLGLSLDSDLVCVDLIERHTEPASVPIGGKYETIRGWVGYIIVDVNAPGRWLLECAARVGFGGRTSLGFGRVRVSEVA